MSDERNYIIEQRSGKWCLLVHDRSKVLGCHETKEEAEAQERAIKAQKHAVSASAAYSLNDPGLGDQHLARALSRIGVTVLAPAAELRTIFQGFNEGQCKQWRMEEEGGFTRCSEAMNGKVSDAGAFCSALHQWYTDKWPAEKSSSEPTAADAIKDFMPMLAETANEVQAPVHRMFDEIFAKQESQEHVNRAVWALSDSINSIVADKTLDGDGKRKMLTSTFDQFVTKMKSILPGLSSYALVETALRKFAGTEDGMECKMPDGSKGKMMDGKCMSKASYEAKKSKTGDSEDLYTISGVEIFATGTHNGDKYAAKDLDDMVEAYNAQGYQAPLKLGHDETPGRPAVGWVANLRRVGEKLVGDITNIPKDIYELIKKRGYDRVSAEIYWNLKSAGKTFRRALKAVALLGADVPAVSSLTPLHKLFSGMEGTVKIYDSTRGGKKMPGEKEQLEALQSQLADLQNKLDGGGNGDSDDERITAMTKTVSAMQDQVRLLQRKLDEKQEVEKRFLAAQEEIQTLSKSLKEMQEDQRGERIDKIVSEIRIPAFRPYFRAFLDVATAEPKTVKFSRPGAKTEERTVEQLVKDMIADMNKMSHSIFKEHLEHGHKLSDGQTIDLEDKGAVSIFVDQKAQSYATQHKVDYQVALKAVLDADPDLKSAYSS